MRYYDDEPYSVHETDYGGFPFVDIFVGMFQIVSGLVTLIYLSIVRKR